MLSRIFLVRISHAFFFLGTIDRFKQLQDIGQKIMASSSSVGIMDVCESTHKLAQQSHELEELWAKRQKKLQDQVELQKFSREVDYVLAALSSHEAFLRSDHLGVRSTN